MFTKITRVVINGTFPPGGNVCIVAGSVTFYDSLETFAEQTII